MATHGASKLRPFTNRDAQRRRDQQIPIHRVHLRRRHNHTVRIQPRTSFTPVGKSHSLSASGHPGHQRTSQEALKVDDQIKPLRPQRQGLTDPRRQGGIDRPHGIDSFDSLHDLSPLSLHQPGQMR
jgi:hypothetical protein